MNELELSTITVNGAALDLADVLADVTIRHGRTGYFDSASPSTCQITLLGVTRALTAPFRLGSLLVVNATDGATDAPRFTGRFTDASLDGDVLTAIAVGELRTLPGYALGGAFPEERWSERVTRAFDVAGLGGEYGANVAPSPSFDSLAGWDGWNDGRQTLALDSVVHDGNPPSAKVTQLTDGASFPWVGLYSWPAIPLLAGRSYRLAARFRAPAGQAFTYFGVDFYDAADNYLESSYTYFTPRGDWQTIERTVVAPVGATGASLGFYVDAGNPVGAGFNLDNVEFAEVVTPAVLVLEVGPFDPILVAEDAPSSPRTLGGYLDELAAMVDAAVADLPDGRVLVQAIDSRTIGNAYALDPAQVGYAPQWELRLPEANLVTVTYGPDSSSSINASDLGSVALYGPIAAAIATTVRDAVDAQAIGTARIAANAYARWTVGDAPLLVGRRLAIGTPVKLSSLPAAAPHDSWTPLLEGWTDHVVSDGERLEWTMELALSDPLLSGLVLPWDAVPVDAAYQWNTINQSTAWRDALSLDALDP